MATERQQDVQEAVRSADLAFSRIFYEAGPNHQRLLLNAMYCWVWMSATPVWFGTGEREDLVRTFEALGRTCQTLGYSIDDVILWDAGDILRRGPLLETARGCPTGRFAPVEQSS